MAFVGNACRLPEGATAGDIPRGLRANGGLGPGRLGSSSGWAGYGGALEATAPPVSSGAAESEASKGSV